MTNNGVLLYGDSTHINRQGSVYLAERLIENNPEFKRALTLTTPNSTD